MTSELDKYGLGALPWSKRDTETAKQHAAFVVYRDLGRRRTLRAAALVYYEIPEGQFDPGQGKIRTFEKWSARNQWVVRAEQYDEYMQAVADADHVQSVVDMKTRHAAIATAAQGKIVAALNHIDMKDLSALQLMQVFDIVVKNERLARGVPASVDAIVSQDSSPQIDAVRDEDLEAKLASWRMARDPKNTIEAGEPDTGAAEGPQED